MVVESSLSRIKNRPFVIKHYISCIIKIFRQQRGIDVAADVCKKTSELSTGSTGDHLSGPV